MASVGLFKLQICKSQLFSTIQSEDFVTFGSVSLAYCMKQFDENLFWMCSEYHCYLTVLPSTYFF